VTTSDANDVVTPEDVVLMQGLAQRIVAGHPKFINPDASFGELAWVWGKGHLAWRDTWPKKLWFDAEGRLVAWGWARMPFHVVRTNGAEKDVTDISVTFQVHPDHEELVDEVIAWFESITPADVDRRVVMQSNDEYGLARWAAFGYLPDRRPRTTGPGRTSGNSTASRCRRCPRGTGCGPPRRSGTTPRRRPMSSMVAVVDHGRDVPGAEGDGDVPAGPACRGRGTRRDDGRFGGRLVSTR